MTNNKAAMCNCPRQCRELSYKPDISQALISNKLAKLARDAINPHMSVDEFRSEHCFVEVRLFVSSPMFETHNSARHIQGEPKT